MRYRRVTMAHNGHKSYVTLSEACRLLKCSPWKISSLLKQGKIEAIARGSQKHYYVSAYLERQSASAVIENTSQRLSAIAVALANGYSAPALSQIDSKNLVRTLAIIRELKEVPAAGSALRRAGCPRN
jgi:hypothetical protein